MSRWKFCKFSALPKSIMYLEHLKSNGAHCRFLYPGDVDCRYCNEKIPKELLIMLKLMNG